MKTRGTDTDAVGVHFHADPEAHPGILQLAEVGYLPGGGVGGVGSKGLFRRNLVVFDFS